MNILVTDGENRSALAVTRSLGRQGYNVFVSGKDAGNISACSKFCRKAFKVPDPMNNRSYYSAAVSEIVTRNNIDVIFPMTEQSVYCLNKARKLFGKSVVIACASSGKMEQVSNKYRLFQMAEKLGVAIPNTIFIADFHDFTAKRATIPAFPVVVKPAFSKMEVGVKIFSAGVMYAADQRELDFLYETKPVLRFPSLIQELIVGEGTGLFTLFDHDHHLALFSHQRLLEKPPSGGVSVLSESVRLDDEMIEAARKLLAEVGWEGIAMVEFKRDVRDGRAKLMEINGRFWGSLQLAVSSGVNFPVLCLDYYLGRKPVSVATDYTVGHRLKWVFGMLDHLIIRIKRGGCLINVPPGSLSCWQVARELMRIRDRNSSSDVYDFSDLRPVFSEFKSYILNKG